MRAVIITLISLIVVAAVFGIFWTGSQGFGMRQAVEFFPYDDEFELDDETIIRSSGVVVLINEYEAAPSDQEMATLMVSAFRMYPEECSGENWEIAVRRPNPDGGEEKYSFSYSIYEISGPGSRIEYGCWEGSHYVVIESYPADWPEIDSIAQGNGTFHVRAE